MVLQTNQKIQTMGKYFKHLTLDDRRKIENLINTGHSKQTIADAIGCCLKTVYNELKRATYEHLDGKWGTLETRYNPEGAHLKYRAALKDKGTRPKILEAPKLREAIRHYIVDLNYSPRATLYAIQNSGATYEMEIKSVNTIYTAIRRGYIEGVTMKHLPCRDRHKRKKKKVSKSTAKGKSIEKRPDYINDRSTFGHWEMDTVESDRNGKSALLVLTERKTRFEIIEPVKNQTIAETVRVLNRIERDMGALFYQVFKSITVDNGGEFKDPDRITKALRRKNERTDMYYCHPYSPHERGSNENNNKFIRRKYPKGTNFDKEKLTRKECYYLAEWINGYPRRLFNGESARQRFNRELDALECG